MLGSKKEGETVDEFYRSLTSLITYCQYRNVKLKEQVRDRLVVGLRERKLKERLQLTHDLTLTKALEIARQDEQVKQQMREKNNEVSNEADEARQEYLGIGLLQHRLVGLLKDSRNKFGPRRISEPPWQWKSKRGCFKSKRAVWTMWPAAC